MNLKNTRIQRTWIKIAAIVSAVNVLLSPVATLAGTQYWDADAQTWDTTTSNWSASSSGGSLTTWTDNNDAVFSAGTGHSGTLTITVSGTRTANSLTIEEGTLTFSGGTALQIGTGGLTLNSGIGATTISTPITLGGSQSWANNSSSLLTVQTGSVTIGGNTLTIGGSANTTISAPITGSGNITKTGSGTVTINPTDANFNCTMTLSGGTLKLTTPTALVGTAAVDLRAAAAATPSAVTASSYYAGDNRPPKKVSLWDGMNKSWYDTTASSASDTQYQWLSDGTTGNGTWIAWDLGASYTIGSMHIWNGNEGGIYLDRGIKTMDLQTSSDGITWNNVTDLTSVTWGSPGANQGTITGVTQGTGNPSTNTGFDWTLPSPITTRYIRFNKTFNFNGSGFTGLDEVLFFTLAIQPVNLPATAIAAAADSTLDLAAVSENHTLGNVTVTAGASANTTLTVSNVTKLTIGTLTIGINGAYYGKLNLGAKELTLGNGSVTKLAVTSVSPTVTTCCVAVAKDGSFAGLHGTQVTDDNSKKWNVSVVDDGTMDQLWLTAASGGMIILFR